MGPGIWTVQLSYFGKLKFIFVIDYRWVLFVRLVKALGNQFAAVRNTSHNALELNYTLITKCFSCPTKVSPCVTGLSRSPVKTYLKVREAATC